MATGRATPGKGLVLPSAALWNHTLDAGREYGERQRLGRGEAPRTRGIPTDLVRIKNASGGSLARGRVLELGSPLVTTVTPEDLSFTGSTPAPDGTKAIAVLREALAANAIGEAQVSGICLCRLNVNHIQQTRADVDTGSTLLQSKWHGRGEIVWKETESTGEQDAAIRLVEMFRGPIEVVITQSGGIAAGGSGTAKVRWAGSDASPAASITVYFTHMASGTAAENADAIAFWHPDKQKYVITELECG